MQLARFHYTKKDRSQAEYLVLILEDDGNTLKEGGSASGARGQLIGLKADSLTDDEIAKIRKNAAALDEMRPHRRKLWFQNNIQSRHAFRRFDKGRMKGLSFHEVKPE